MLVTTNIIDIDKYLADNLKPADLINRDNVIWLTRDLPLLIVPESANGWGIAKEGDLVRIPLIPYLAKGTDPSVAMGFAFELGFKACDGIDYIGKVKRLHIAVGYPVTETKFQGHDMLRFWLGFGCTLQER
jgi:hypothetical protein